MAGSLPPMAKKGPLAEGRRPKSERIVRGDRRVTRRAAASSVQVAVERLHLARDDVERVLDREVAGVEPMHLGVGQDFQEGLAALLREEDVRLAPEDDRLRLPLLQECLPLRIERDVGAVVVEEVELNLLGVRAFQEVVVHVPVVGADLRRVRMAVQIDRLYGVWLEEGSDRLLVLGAAALPVRYAP